MEERQKVLASPDNYVESLLNKFIPFWPVFPLLCLVFLALAFVYLINEKPTYEVTASIIINDEETSASNNSTFRVLDAYQTRQIVDNEVLVLQSRSLMKSVVNSLRLYARISTEKSKSNGQAFSVSPLIIEAKEPDKIQKAENLVCEFDPKTSRVKIENRNYGLNEWIRFPYGTIRFSRNNQYPYRGSETFYVSLTNPTILADGLLKGLKVSAVSKLSTVINIAFRAETPQQGEAIVNELLSAYLRKSAENENILAANTLAFVEERLRDVGRELDSIETRIQQFRSSEGIVDLTEQGRIYLQSIAENDRKITDINAQLAALDQVMRYVNEPGSRTGIVPTTLGIDDPVLSELLQQLNRLELQLSNLSTTTGENNPIITSVKNEIQKIQPSITSIVNNQRARLLASRNNIIARSNTFNTNIRDIPQQERELLEISRQQAVKRDLYSFLLERREEAALSNASALAENKIIDRADASVATPSSRRVIVVLGCIAAAFGLGLLYILYQEGLTNTILFRTEIEKLTSVPVVGEIVYTKQHALAMLKNRQHSGFVQQFRNIHTALGLFKGPVERQKVLVTSSMPNEGKSFVSSCFAATLALSGKKVILLDFNLRSPEVSHLFTLQQEKGIRDFLSRKTGIQQMIKKTELDQLDVVPAGARTDNSIQLLSSNELRDLFDFLEQQYDYIVIDSPPVELATDAYILSSYSDLTLFVVRHAKTPKYVVQAMDTNTRLAQLKNLKIVFNGVKGRGFLKKYYGYGYGYGKENMFSEKDFAEAD